MKKLFCVFGVSATEVLIVFAKVAAVVDQEREFLFFWCTFQQSYHHFYSIETSEK